MTDAVDDFLEKYKAALLNAGLLDAELDRLEERRRIAFSTAFNAAGDMPASKAEHVARASEGYREAADAVDAIRKPAAEAKALATYYAARFEAWRTRSATRRTEMSIGGGR